MVSQEVFKNQRDLTYANVVRFRQLFREQIPINRFRNSEKAVAGIYVKFRVMANASL